jgi:hypothetical protein
MMAAEFQRHPTGFRPEITTGSFMREQESRYLDNANRGSPGGSCPVVANDRRGLISGEE